jgi:putative tryptophan/tyrosine transport system substrate-binding protein
VIVTPGESAALAAKAATATIPIAFIMADDPVKVGLVTSLARPGGNATGISFLAAEVEAKRLQLFREVVPGASRIVVLVNPAEARRSESRIRALEAAARTMTLEVQVLKAGTSREIEDAFGSIDRTRPGGLFVETSPFLAVRNVQWCRPECGRNLRVAISSGVKLSDCRFAFKQFPGREGEPLGSPLVSFSRGVRYLSTPLF